jgi:DNA-binding beta-propeller fold protein YncE
MPAPRPRSVPVHAVRLVLLAGTAILLVACGSSRQDPAPRAADGAANGSAASGRPAARSADPPARLRTVARGRLPAPVQLPAVARLGDGTVLAMGGLDAADSSVDSVVRVAPGSPRRVGRLPQAAHDIGAAAIGGKAYAFGGGTASGPVASITAVGAAGSAQGAGRLPVAMSDTAAATIGDTAYVVGGYTTTTPLRSVLAFRPGARPRLVAALPHPLRYPAVAAVGGRIMVAGGTSGTQARREVLSVDPATHAVRTVARLPAPLTHAAGAALNGKFYVLGGRGDSLTAQRAAIWVVDPARRTVHSAGRLPAALSDLGAATTGDRILVAGGRDAKGTVQDELWTLAAAAAKPASAPTRAAADALRPGRIPPLLSTTDVYAAGRPGLLAPQVRNDPARVYVPNSQSNTVDVISQRTGKVVDHFAVGTLPQHVTPSWDLRTLWVTNDVGNSLTPINPRTGRHGRPVPVRDPYNLYFTADGRRAIVVAEAHRALDFRDAKTMRLRHSLNVPQCAGIDHMDYTADGRLALASCEFAGRMVVVDLRRERVTKTIDLRSGAMPQDVKLSPDGRTFYVADMAANGVWLIDARTMTKIRLQPTGRGTHGLYPSRDSRLLYVSNRGEGSISVISFRTRRPIKKWHLPGGGSPDMGGVSADGKVLWLSGRYNSEVYAISTRTGKLLRRIQVGRGPHGMCVWPQPGRYSIGHTGILR